MRQNYMEKGDRASDRSTRRRFLPEGFLLFPSEHIMERAIFPMGAPPNIFVQRRARVKSGARMRAYTQRVVLLASAPRGPFVTALTRGQCRRLILFRADHGTLSTKHKSPRGLRAPKHHTNEPEKRTVPRERPAGHLCCDYDY